MKTIELQKSICNNFRRVTREGLAKAVQDSLKGMTEVAIKFVEKPDVFEKSNSAVHSHDKETKEVKRLALNILMGRTSHVKPNEHEFDNIIKFMNERKISADKIESTIYGINGLKRGAKDPVIRQSIISEIKGNDIEDLIDVELALYRWNKLIDVDNSLNNYAYPITGNGYRYMQFKRIEDEIIKKINSEKKCNIPTIFDEFVATNIDETPTRKDVLFLKNALELDPLKEYIQEYNSCIKHNSLDLDVFRKYLRTDIDKFKQKGKDGIIELDFNSLINGYDDFENNNIEINNRKTRYLTDYLYKKYYLSRLSPEPKNICSKILNEFGIALFVEDETSANASKLVYKELTEWKTKSGNNFITPPLLDLNSFGAIKYLTEDSGGYYETINETIHLKGEEFITQTLRHEMVHANDLNPQKTGVINDINFDKISVKNPEKSEKESGNLIFSQCLYRDEFLNAGIFPNHIKYAYKDAKEFKAVASEGDCSRYSPEFKELLIKLGLKPYILEMKPCSKEFVKRAEIIAKARKQGKDISSFWL